MTTLKGQHALVTGANRGIGLAIVRALAAQGADVTLLVRDAAAGQKLAKSIADAHDVRAGVVVADVTDREALARGTADAARSLGPVTILVNNAGSADSAPFLKLGVSEFERMFAIHVLAAVTTMQAVLPAMLERGKGRIVNVASIAGLQGAPYVAHYTAAKHALVGLTRAVALEVAAKGVTVNAVCPGYTETDLVAGSVARIAAKTGISPDDARRRILSDAGQSRFVTAEEVAKAVVGFCGSAGDGVTGQAAILMGHD